ncbi:TRAP transporter large permease subunit [Aminithiophilus ramosus]|uniref:TRAP transporter large permease subunit n=2 Tax=Synergistales TaxID=649776 RepID=A0A9Q7A9T9_9BACT|nr:TRAP transporter large permease subunit [Aminithiophilus ramosus]QTX31398.1 TRAP transporter large permease subunit [Aminithiophilus ramosus]QVL35197.1 TRAP transporter large permease subunit [Synergistota bacterium]
MEIGVLLLVGMIVLIALSVPVAFAIGIASMSAIIMGHFQLIIIPQKIFAGLDSFPMLAIPFFVLAGNLMTAGGINDKIMRFATAVAGWMRGSLGIITVVASAIFSSISGSGTATVTAIGGITIPAMKKEGYPASFAAAIAGSSSILGPLIPPSIILIVYGSSVQSSIKDLFLAAVIPGLMLTTGFIVYTYFMARRLNLPVSEKLSVPVILRETRKSIWALLMPVIILGGIFGGVFTPTEAAAVSAVYAFVVGVFVYRNIRIGQVGRIFYESCITSTIMLFLVGCSKVSSWVLAVAKVPEAISQGLLSVTSSPVLLLLLINVFLLVVGMFMEANVAVVIFTPILLPIALACGLSVVQFGVVMCLNLCIGLVTPPVGLCALLGNGIAEARLEETLRASIAFMAVGLAVLLLTTYVPALTLWLPAAMR